jgi:hypothetical protein
VSGLGLVELSPLTVSISAASFEFNINFAVGWWLLFSCGYGEESQRTLLAYCGHGVDFGGCCCPCYVFRCFVQLRLVELMSVAAGWLIP